MVLHRWLDAFYRRTPRKHHNRRKVCRAEPLEQRTLLTVTVLYQPLVGLLTANAGADGDVILVSHNGNLVFINDTAIPDPDSDTGEFVKLSDVSGIILFGSSTEEHATDFRVESDFTAFTIGMTPGPGNDTVVGGPGREVIVDSSGDNDLRGNGGNDTISGGSGNDILVGGAGDDSIVGFGGNDQIFGDAGNDTLIGGIGNDTLQGGTDDDELDGGDGNDSLFGQGGDDSIVGGTGDDGYGFEGAAQGQDTLDESPGEDEGEDFIEFSFFSFGVMLSIATANPQTVAPGNLDLTLSSGFAFEIIIGSANNDTLLGNSGDNFLFGGEGNDSVSGGAGDDFLFGQLGDDTLEGEAGADTLNAGAGNNSVRGGAGDDSLVSLAGDDTLEGDDGADTINAGAGNNSVSGGAGDDSLFSLEGNDTLVGDDGADTLIAGAGDDMLDGGLGHDRLDGGDGDDQLDGREGRNTIRDGNGDDLFMFTTSGDIRYESSGGGLDTLDFSLLSQRVVIDFSRIDLSQFFLADGSLLFLERAVEKLIGTNFNDVFFGTASPSVVTTISGRGQNGQPGDTLFVRLEGVDNPVLPPGNSDSGTVTSDNGQPINFDGMERFGVLNPDPAPAVSGTTASDTATIGFDTVAGLVEVLIGDDLALLQQTGGLQSLTVNLGDNDDKLLVNLPDNLLPLEINYDGGLGADSLEVIGTGVSSVNVELLDASSGTLEIVPLDPNGLPAPESLILINYTGLEPVDLTELPIGGIQFELPESDDNAVLEPTGVPGEFVLRSTNGTFEETSFLMPESLTILDNGGNDTLTIDAQNQLVLRDGDKITIGDEFPITVQGVETVHFVNAVEVPSQGVLVVGTTLFVVGDDGRDRITITESRRGISVTIGRERLRIPAAGLTQLKVFGLAGHDRISVRLTSPLDIAIDAGSGNDRVSMFGNRAATIDGGSGADCLRGGNGADLLRGGIGNDTLDGGRGDDRLFGGSGHDRVSGESGHDTLVGDDGDDTLLGGSGNDAINGNAGHDWIDGHSGNDTLLGEAGNDSLRGSSGADLILAGPDDDRILTGSQDTVSSGTGIDRLIGRPNLIDEAFVFDFEALLTGP